MIARLNSASAASSFGGLVATNASEQLLRFVVALQADAARSPAR